MVVKDGGRYLMFAEGENDRAQLLASPDGVAWERLGRLDVRLAGGAPIPDGPYSTPTAFRDGTRWPLFYERSDKGVWLATSDDLKVWRNVRDELVLIPGPGAYDREMIALNQVVKYGGRYYAYYHGCATTGPNARKWSVAVAASDDLINWKKYPGNPLLPIAKNRSSGILVNTGSGFRLYTMHPVAYPATNSPAVSTLRKTHFSIGVYTLPPTTIFMAILPLRRSVAERPSPPVGGAPGGNTSQNHYTPPPSAAASGSASCALPTASPTFALAAHSSTASGRPHSKQWL
jgi:hypothetical protein